MTTISVTLTSKHLRCLDDLVDDGLGKSRADVMRIALERLAEEAAIIAMLAAATEGPMRGGLRGFFDPD